MTFLFHPSETSIFGQALMRGPTRVFPTDSAFDSMPHIGEGSCFLVFFQPAGKDAHLVVAGARIIGVSLLFAGTYDFVAPVHLVEGQLHYFLPSAGVEETRVFAPHQAWESHAENLGH